MHFKANQRAPRGYRYTEHDTRDCEYCGKPEHARDWSEGGAPNWSVGIHHFDCWHSASASGRYIVLNARDVNDGRENGYPFLKRAIHQAEYYAGHNLDIHRYVVIDRETGKEVFSIQGKCVLR